jgi:hypothetical protein
VSTTELPSWNKEHETNLKLAAHAQPEDQDHLRDWTVVLVDGDARYGYRRGMPNGALCDAFAS